MAHPLADATTLPPFSAITPEAIGPAIAAVLAERDTIVEHVVRTAPQSFGEAWLPLERSNVAIGALWSAVSHLQAVADTPALREAHAAGQAQLAESSMRIQQNSDLHDLFTKLAAMPDFAALPQADRVAVEHAIRNATLAGVALAPEARTRFAEISVELSALSNAFSSAVLDATDAWSEHVTDEAVLAGRELVLDQQHRLVLIQRFADGQHGHGWAHRTGPR
jgi:oligopeptidase A